MANAVRFPIRAKLLLLTSGLILVATGSYLALAVGLFRDDKTSLVYELNASAVKTLAAETEASLGKVADKIKLLTQGHRDEAWTRAVLEAEPDLISFTLFEPDGSGGWKPVFSVRNADYLKLYGFGSLDIERIRETVPVPFAQVVASRTWAANATAAGGAPILTLALALELAGSEGAAASDRIAVADLRLDRLLKLVSGRGVATTYLVDARGGVIAHPDAALVSQRASLIDVPLVRDALASPVAAQAKAFEWNGETWLGAYATVGAGGIRVVSQVREAEAFRAARRLVEKSAIFALIVVTVGLLLSGWLARQLTEPIERLLEATERLSRWEFGESVHVRTRDEIARLARAFNAMAMDLQSQRAQLESARSELEIKVRERTEALEAEKHHLAQAQDTLVRTTRLASLGELAGAAAHEVLNPVNNLNIRVERLRGQLLEREDADAAMLSEILAAWKTSYGQGGFAALEAELRKPAEDGRPLVEEDLENLLAIAADLSKRTSERREDLEFFGREITRITRIINNMRHLARVGGERRPLDIHAPIEDTALALGDLLEKRQVALVKDFSADPRERFTVTGDKDELVQVFSNLVRNALHALGAAKRRAPVIRVATCRAGARVEVRISDNGTGIKAEHLARIFEPDFTTKSVEEGTGLGLSISRRLVRAFGGDLEVESTQEGEGTTFLVWFPASS